jgi:hypothetical protein
MTSVRSLGANRTTNWPSRIEEASQCDLPLVRGSFPDALGAATNPTPAAQTAMPSRQSRKSAASDALPAEIANSASQHHPAQRTGRGAPGAAMGDPSMGCTADPGEASFDQEPFCPSGSNVQANLESPSASANRPDAPSGHGADAGGQTEPSQKTEDQVSQRNRPEACAPVAFTGAISDSFANTPPARSSANDTAGNPIGENNTRSAIVSSLVDEAYSPALLDGWQRAAQKHDARSQSGSSILLTRDQSLDLAVNEAFPHSFKLSVGEAGSQDIDRDPGALVPSLVDRAFLGPGGDPGNPVGEGNTGSAIVSSLVDKARSSAPLDGWQRSAQEHDTLSQSGPNISFAQDQSLDVAVNEALPHSFKLGVGETGSQEIDRDPGALVPAFVDRAFPDFGGDPNAAPPRSVPAGGKASDVATSEGQAALAASTLGGSEPLIGLKAQGSSDSGSFSSSNGLADQLSYQLTGLITSGGHEVVLRLHPPELGDLTLRILVNGREVSAWFGSPQLQVQQAINQAIGQLQTNLGNAGYSLTGAWVGADAWSPAERDESSAPPQQRSGGSQPSLAQSQGSTPLSAASGVSIFV